MAYSTFKPHLVYQNVQGAEGLDFVDINDEATPGISGQLRVILLQSEIIPSEDDAIYFKHYEY